MQGAAHILSIYTKLPWKRRQHRIVNNGLVLTYATRATARNQRERWHSAGKGDTSRCFPLNYMSNFPSYVKCQRQPQCVLLLFPPQAWADDKWKHRSHCQSRKGGAHSFGFGCFVATAPSACQPQASWASGPQLRCLPNGKSTQCGGWRAASRSVFSLSTIWGFGIELA